MNFANLMMGQQNSWQQQQNQKLLMANMAQGNSGYATLQGGAYVPSTEQSPTNYFFGDAAPEAEGWFVSGTMQRPVATGGYGVNGPRNATRTVNVWSKMAQQGQQQEQQQEQQAAPTALAIPASTAPDMTQLNATLAASQAAMDETRGTYAKQNDELMGTIKGLQDLLLRTREESTSALKIQQEESASALRNQENAFNNFMLINSDQSGVARALYEGQLGMKAGGLPSPERGAVAARLGDARTGGRNAATNTLSQLRIIAPSMLGIAEGSGSLGRL
jgi:hypothetical protein